MESFVVLGIKIPVSVLSLKLWFSKWGAWRCQFRFDAIDVSPWGGVYLPKGALQKMFWEPLHEDLIRESEM